MNLEYLRLQSALGTLATAELNLERGMPASIEAEKSILGAILLDNLAYNEAAETLKRAGLPFAAVIDRLPPGQRRRSGTRCAATSIFWARRGAGGTWSPAPSCLR